MNPRDFVIGLRESIVSENLAIYRDLLEKTESANVTDLHWSRALAFYSDLTDDQRAVLLEIIHQVMVDTLSNILGIIDGVATMGGDEYEIELRLTPDGKRVNGHLQESFLELEEMRSRDP